jgi:hypothetical protein
VAGDACAKQRERDDSAGQERAFPMKRLLTWLAVRLAILAELWRRRKKQ